LQWAEEVTEMSRKFVDCFSGSVITEWSNFAGEQMLSILTGLFELQILLGDFWESQTRVECSDV
jgi:hypothetical protein